VPTFYVILQGFQKLALVNGLTTGVNIVGSVTGLLLVWMGFGVVGLAIGQFVSTILGAVFALYWSRKLFRFSLSPRIASRGELVEMGRFAMYFTMSKVAFLGSKFSDTILIAMYYGTAPVTQFTLTQKLASVSFMFASKVGPVTVPGLAEMIGSGDTAALRSVILRLTMILSRVAIAAAAFVVTLNHRFVSLWTGEAFFGGLLLTALFAWGIFRDTMIRNLSALLFASGELKGWGILSLAEAMVKIGLSVALLPSFGIVAPVIGTAVGELITGIYTPVKLRSLLGLDIGGMFTGAFLPALLRSLPMIVVLAALTFAVPVQWRWFGLALIAAGGAVANVLAFDRGRLAAFQSLLGGRS
jgi:O-antigen/teichoic acid export membrane protein